MNEELKKIQFHFYFSDKSHSMNAFVLNECEKELLHIFKDLAEQLTLNVEIEKEALREGGLKDIWKFSGKNSVQINIFLTAFNIFISRFPVENKQLVKLQIENLQIDNKLKKVELKKIQLENNGTIDSIAEIVVNKIERDYKLNWHKSNFYKKIYNYQKIDKVSVQVLNKQNEPTKKETFISNDIFSNFIISNDSFPPIIDDDALIYIISPVLTQRNYQWKGVYKNETLSFEMKDKTFKNAVINKQIEFVNGIAIRCVLFRNRKINEIGIVNFTNNQVKTVVEIIEDNKVVETSQGKKLRNKTIDKSYQLSLFTD